MQNSAGSVKSVAQVNSQILVAQEPDPDQFGNDEGGRRRGLIGLGQFRTDGEEGADSIFRPSEETWLLEHEKY